MGTFEIVISITVPTLGLTCYHEPYVTLDLTSQTNCQMCQCAETVPPVCDKKFSPPFPLSCTCRILIKQFKLTSSHCHIDFIGSANSPSAFSVRRPLCFLSKKLRELHDSSSDGSRPSLELFLPEFEFRDVICSSKAFCCCLCGLEDASSQSSLEEECRDDFRGLLPADLVPIDETALLPCLAELFRGIENISSSLKLQTLLYTVCNPLVNTFILLTKYKQLCLPFY